MDFPGLNLPQVTYQYSLNSGISGCDLYQFLAQNSEMPPGYYLQHFSLANLPSGYYLHYFSLLLHFSLTNMPPACYLQGLCLATMPPGCYL